MRKKSRIHQHHVTCYSPKHLTQFELFCSSLCSTIYLRLCLVSWGFGLTFRHVSMCLWQERLSSYLAVVNAPAAKRTPRPQDMFIIFPAGEPPESIICTPHNLKVFIPLRPTINRHIQRDTCLKLAANLPSLPSNQTAALYQAVVVWSARGIVAGGVVEGVWRLRATVGVAVGEDNSLRGCTFGERSVGGGGRGSIVKNDNIGRATYLSWGLDGGGGGCEGGENEGGEGKEAGELHDGLLSEVWVWLWLWSVWGELMMGIFSRRKVSFYSLAFYSTPVDISSSPRRGIHHASRSGLW